MKQSTLVKKVWLDPTTFKLFVQKTCRITRKDFDTSRRALQNAEWDMERIVDCGFVLFPDHAATNLHERLHERLSAILAEVTKQPPLLPQATAAVPALPPTGPAKTTPPEEDIKVNVRTETALPAEWVDFPLPRGKVIRLPVVRTPSGGVYLVLSRMCDLLGIDTFRQIQKIRAREIWAHRLMLVQLAERAAPGRVFCLELDAVMPWLNSVSPEKVHRDMREGLLLLQKDIYDAIAKHFRLGKWAKKHKKHKKNKGALTQEMMAQFGQLIVTGVVAAMREINRPIDARLEQMAADTRMAADTVDILTRGAMLVQPRNKEFMWAHDFVTELNEKHLKIWYECAKKGLFFYDNKNTTTKLMVKLVTTNHLYNMLRMYEPNAYAALTDKEGDKLVVRKDAFPFVTAIFQWWYSTRCGATTKCVVGKHATATGGFVPDHMVLNRKDFNKRMTAVGHDILELDKLFNQYEATCPRYSTFNTQAG
jgi:hypothetical protein